MKRAALPLAAAIALCLIELPTPARSAIALSAEQARRADDFVATICPNVHAAYATTPYANLATTGVTQLSGMGISCVRDGATHNDSGSHDEKLRALGAAGINGSITFAYTDTASWVAGEAALLAPFKILACESQNEPNSTMPAGWPATLASWEVNTFIPNCPVPRFYGASPTYANVAQQYGDHSQYSSLNWYWNCHCYQSGHNPGTTGFGSNGYGSMASNLIYSRLGGITLPGAATEEGFFQYRGTSGVPEDIQARYEARMCLLGFNFGLAACGIYELYDESNDMTALFQGGGLYRFDGTPKPAAIMLQNLIATVQDRSTAFTPDSLSWSLSGTTANVAHTLLEKGDGTMELALHVESPGYDVNNRVYTPVASQAVTLNVGSRVTTGATTTTFAASGAATTTPLSCSAGSCALTLTDIPQVIKLPPVTTPATIAGATPPPSPAPSAFLATPAPAPTGFISMATGPNTAPSPNPVDVSTGYLDFSIFNGTTLDYKSAQFPWFSKPTFSTAPAPSKIGTYASFPTGYMYASGGTPDASQANVTTAQFFEGAGSSLGIPVLADRTLRVATFWYNAMCVQPKFYASLSDGSYAFQSILGVNDTSGNSPRYVTVTYKAGQSQQTLTFSAQIQTDNGTSACTPIAESDGVGALAVRAAAMATPSPAPSSGP